MRAFPLRFVVAWSILALSACSEPGEVRFVLADGTSVTNNARYTFGPSRSGSGDQRAISVVNEGGDVATISAFTVVRGVAVVDTESSRPERSHFEVEFTPVTLAPGETRSITVTYFPNGDAPVFEDEAIVRFDVEERGSAPRLVDVVLRGRGAKVACPSNLVLDFGPVGLGDSSELTFPVPNPGNRLERLLVGEIYSTGGDASSFSYVGDLAAGENELGPESNGELRIAFAPSSESDYVAFAKWTTPGCREVIVTLAGSGVAQPLTTSPDEIDCGFAAPGQTVSRTVKLQNSSAAAVTVSELAGRPIETFAVQDAASGPVVVPAATKGADGLWTPGTLERVVTCKPQQLGPVSGMISFQTDRASQPMGSIPVSVFGGGPDLDVVETLDFGEVAYFSNANPPSMDWRWLRVSNVAPPEAGSAERPATLRLGVAEASGQHAPPYATVVPGNPETSADEFTVLSPPEYDPALGIAPDGHTDLRVTFTPRSVGFKEARLIVHSNDPDEPAREVLLRAAAVVLPPCNYSVTGGPALDFGFVGFGEERERSFAIRNNGTNPGDVCLVSPVHVVPDQQDATFSLVNAPQTPTKLGPGAELTVTVHAINRTASGAPMEVTANIDLRVSSPIKPSSALEARAHLGQRCLVVTPGEVDFGTTLIGCRSATRSLALQNICAQPITLTGFSMPNAPANPELVLLQAPAIPPGGLELGPSGSSPPVTIEVEHQPMNAGTDTQAMAVGVTQAAVAVKYELELRGTGSTTGLHTDSFLQPGPTKADYLFLIDNATYTSSGGFFHSSLQTNLPKLMPAALASSTDFHLAVAACDVTSMLYGAFETGPSHPETVMKRGTPNLVAKFADKADIDWKGGSQDCLAVALAALGEPLTSTSNAGFLRPDADLHVVLINHTFHAPMSSVSHYLNGLWNVKGFDRKDLLQIHTVAPSPACTTNPVPSEPLSLATGGLVLDFCAPDWGAPLGSIFQSQPPGVFPLTGEVDTTTAPLEVSVNGTPINATAPNGDTVWTYDAAANTISFHAAYQPSVGDVVTATYQRPCY